MLFACLAVVFLMKMNAVKLYFLFFGLLLLLLCCNHDNGQKLGKHDDATSD